jgi:heme-degrading monooxygenase HmoA
MIVTLFPFHLASPGDAEDLAEVFRRHKVLEMASKVEGCRGVYLAEGDAIGAARAYAVGLWDDTTAYQRWLDHPERQVASDDINALLRGADDLDVPGQVLTVLHAAE